MSDCNSQELDKDIDQEKRALLKEHSVPDPGDIGLLRTVRFNMGASGWYCETVDGTIYWFSGKEWKLCPQGYSWLIGR